MQGATWTIAPDPSQDFWLGWPDHKQQQLSGVAHTPRITQY